MEDRILLAEGDVEKVDLILRRMRLEGRTDWVNLGDIEGFIDEVSSLRGRSQEEVGRAVALVVGKALSGGMFISFEWTQIRPAVACASLM